MDIAEINHYIEIKGDDKRQELKLRAYFDHTLAVLVGYSLNDPNHMPSLYKAYPTLYKSEAEQEEWRSVKARFERYALQKNSVMNKGGA